MHTNITKRLLKIALLFVFLLVLFQLVAPIIPVAHASQRTYDTDNNTVIAVGGGAGGGGPSGTPGASGGVGDDPDEDTTEDEDGEDETPKCEEEFDFPGAWLACLFLQIVDDFTNEAIEAVNSMLAIEESEVNDDSLKQAWSYFRNIASLLLVIIGLVMIIGQAISKE